MVMRWHIPTFSGTASISALQNANDPILSKLWHKTISQDLFVMAWPMLNYSIIMRHPDVAIIDDAYGAKIIRDIEYTTHNGHW